MVEGEIFRIAVLAEKVENPFLLLRIEQPFTAIKAIEGAMPTKVGLHLVVQRGVVFLLHFLEKLFESVSHSLDTCFLEVRTHILLEGCRIYGESQCEVIGSKLARQKAQASPMTGAFFAET